MVEQLPLFSTVSDQPTTRRRPGRKFLSETRQMMVAFSGSETLRRVLTQAAEGEAEITGQEWGAIYENRVLELLGNPQTAEKLSAEVVELAAADGVRLDRVEVIPLVGRAYCDFHVKFYMRTETRTIPVNLKTSGGGTRGGLACSLISFVRLATEKTWDPQNPPSNLGFDVEAAILEWVAGQRKIVHGRDYYILDVTTTGDRDYAGHHITGLLSTVAADGSPVVKRHHTRDNVIYSISTTDRPIPDDYDINTAVSTVLLPRADLSRVRSTLAALAIDGGTDPRLAARAALNYELGMAA